MNTKLNALLIKSIIVGALGGLLFGFDTAVIAGTTQQLTQIFHLTPNARLHRVDCAAGDDHRRDVFRRSRRADRRPREPAHSGGVLRYLRAGLRLLLELDVAAGLPPHRRAGHRRIVGAGAGIYRGDCPGPLAGMLVGSFQMNIVVGILVAYLSNYLMGWVDSESTNGDGCSAWLPLPAVLFS